MSRFIPITTDLEGMGVVSRVEVREQQIKQCMKEVDANPTSVEAWMNYVQLYGLFAEEAETKKERRQFRDFDGYFDDLDDFDDFDDYFDGRFAAGRVGRAWIR